MVRGESLRGEEEGSQRQRQATATNPKQGLKERLKEAHCNGRRPWKETFEGELVLPFILPTEQGGQQQQKKTHWQLVRMALVRKHC